MAMLGLQVLVEAARDFFSSDHSFHLNSLPWVVGVMVGVTGVKLCLFLLCRLYDNDIVQAYAKDHFFDVVTNSLGTWSARVIAERPLWGQIQTDGCGRRQTCQNIRLQFLRTSKVSMDPYLVTAGPDSQQWRLAKFLRATLGHRRVLMRRPSFPAGLAAALLADRFEWWIDPTGAIVLALYTIVNWSGTVRENVQSLVGQSAPPEFLAKITYLCWNHHRDILQVSKPQDMIVHRGVVAGCQMSTVNIRLLVDRGSHMAVMSAFTF